MRWYAGPLPEKTLFDLPVEDAETLEAARFDIIFTGVESDAAKTLEPQYAKSCPVLSTASAFRYEDDVPVLIPGVNDDHARLVEQQRLQRGWKGFISPIEGAAIRGATSLGGCQGFYGLKGTAWHESCFILLRYKSVKASHGSSR